MGLFPLTAFFFSDKLTGVKVKLFSFAPSINTSTHSPSSNKASVVVYFLNTTMHVPAIEYVRRIPRNIYHPVYVLIVLYKPLFLIFPSLCPLYKCQIQNNSNTLSNMWCKMWNINAQSAFDGGVAGEEQENDHRSFSSSGSHFTENGGLRQNAVKFHIPWIYHLWVYHTCCTCKIRDVNQCQLFFI